jgi:hypothetical protein
VERKGREKNLAFGAYEFPISNSEISLQNTELKTKCLPRALLLYQAGAPEKSVTLDCSSTEKHTLPELAG